MRALSFSLPLFVLAALLSASSTAIADAPASPSASAAAASGSALPLDANPPGPEKSKSPTFDEWANATKVALTRTGPAAAPCFAIRVREWFKIRCLGTEPHAMVVLGGDAAEVSFWIDKDDRKGGEVQMPVRRGDRRVIQIWAGGVDKSGVFKAKPSLIIQEYWLESQAAPTITAM